jgi:hypothetical protein
MFAGRFAARMARGVFSVGKPSRSFCYSNVNFSNAFIALKINSVGDNIRIQFNLPDKSFEIELSKANSLKDICDYLVQHNFCK